MRSTRSRSLSLVRWPSATNLAQPPFTSTELGLPGCSLVCHPASSSNACTSFTRNVRNSQPLDLLRTSVACSTPRCDDIDTAWQAVCACACVCVLTALHLRPGIADQWRSPRLRPQVPWPLARRARIRRSDALKAELVTAVPTASTELHLRHVIVAAWTLNRRSAAAKTRRCCGRSQARRHRWLHPPRRFPTSTAAAPTARRKRWPRCVNSSRRSRRRRSCCCCCCCCMSHIPPPAVRAL